MCSLDTVQALRWDVDETQTHPVKCLTDVLKPRLSRVQDGERRVGGKGTGTGRAERKKIGEQGVPTLCSVIV